LGRNESKTGRNESQAGRNKNQTGRNENQGERNRIKMGFSFHEFSCFKYLEQNYQPRRPYPTRAAATRLARWRNRT
jgi:hypothetical protein